MIFAVHNYHTPAIEVDEEGKAGPTGRQLPEPLFTAPTFEEAEAWRQANRPLLKVTL